MNILAVGAHPDDVELGCFGTLWEKKRQGNNVYAVALAPGAYGDHSWEEIHFAWSEAREILKGNDGSSDYILGKFPIGRLQHDWSTVGFVDALIKEYNIDAVITHHYGEAHQDHLAAQRIAISAARRNVDRLWLWETSIYTHRNVLPFRPQLYVPIRPEAFEAKMKALAAYTSAGLLDESEAQAHVHLARYRGAEMHQGYAEAFEIVWSLHEG